MLTRDARATRLQRVDVASSSQCDPLWFWGLGFLSMAVTVPASFLDRRHGVLAGDMLVPNEPRYGAVKACWQESALASSSTQVRGKHGGVVRETPYV